MATNKSNLSLAHLLQVIFQFPDQELEGVSLQLNAGNEEKVFISNRCLHQKPPDSLRESGGF